MSNVYLEKVAEMRAEKPRSYLGANLAGLAGIGSSVHAIKIIHRDSKFTSRTDKTIDRAKGKAKPSIVASLKNKQNKASLKNFGRAGVALAAGAALTGAGLYLSKPGKDN